MVYALYVENQVEGAWVFEVHSLYHSFEGANAAGEELPDDFNFYVEQMEVYA